MYAYLEQDKPPSGPWARLKPNSNSDTLSPAAILYRAAFVAIKLNNNFKNIIKFLFIHFISSQYLEKLTNVNKVVSRS